MEANPEVKYMLLLDEVGGTEEYKVIEAVKNGQIKKPIIAWCIGTIAKYYDSGVQFGHAGASANGDMETAEAKNKAMKEVGIRVPASFNDLPEIISAVYHELHAKGIIKHTHRDQVSRHPAPADPQVRRHFDRSADGDRLAGAFGARSPEHVAQIRVHHRQGATQNHRRGI